MKDCQLPLNKSFQVLLLKYYMYSYIFQVWSILYLFFFLISHKYFLLKIFLFEIRSDVKCTGTSFSYDLDHKSLCCWKLVHCSAWHNPRWSLGWIPKLWVYSGPNVVKWWKNVANYCISVANCHTKCGKMLDSW